MTSRYTERVQEPKIWIYSDIKIIDFTLNKVEQSVCLLGSVLEHKIG